MSKYPEIDELLKATGAFLAGGAPHEHLTAAEEKLGVAFPPSFRDYLLEWGNISLDGREYYGLTRNRDFDKASVPNCVWLTLRKRVAIGLPHPLVVVQNKNDEEYVCIDTDDKLDGAERRIVIWDNIARAISQRLDLNFIDFLREDLSDYVDM
jgi:hypothetical protein